MIFDKAHFTLEELAAALPADMVPLGMTAQQVVLAGLAAVEWIRSGAPLCERCRGRGYYLENFADNHFTPCTCPAGIGGARPVT